MTNRFIVENHWSFDYLDKQLGRLRQWLQGFQQGGGHIPHDFDALRQCQVILNAAKPLPRADELRSLRREMEDAAEELAGAFHKASNASRRFVEALEAAASGMPLRENNEDCSRPQAGSPAPEGGDAQ